MIRQGDRLENPSLERCSSSTRRRARPRASRSWSKRSCGFVAGRACAPRRVSAAASAPWLPQSKAPCAASPNLTACHEALCGAVRELVDHRLRPVGAAAGDCSGDGSVNVPRTVPTRSGHIQGSRAGDTRNDSACPVETEKDRFAGTSHAGGGTRTPDTRIMIPQHLALQSQQPGLRDTKGGHNRGSSCTCRRPRWSHAGLLRVRRRLARDRAGRPAPWLSAPPSGGAPVADHLRRGAALGACVLTSMLLTGAGVGRARRG
jgi:hypothetical protein